MGAGLVVAGLTNYVFLVVAGRALGSEEFAALSVLWAMVFFVAPGVFLPVEQEVSRALSGRLARGEGTGPVIRRAALLGGVLLAVLVTVTVALSVPLVDHLFDGEVLLLVGFLLALVGYWSGHLVRGTMSGLGRFGPYATYIGSEGGVRAAICVVLAVAGASVAGPYGVALGVAPIVAVFIALWGQHGLTSPGPEAPWDELTTSLGALLAGSLFAFGLANGPVVAVNLLATDAESDRAGRFFAGLIFARIPLFLFQAVQAALLPKLSGLAASGRLPEFLAGLRRLLVLVVAIGLAGTAGALLLGPWAVRLLFGGEFDLGRRTITLLAAGTGAYIVALSLAQALIALGRQGLQATAWGIGVVGFVAAVALGDDLLLRVELGYLLGSAIAAVVMGSFLVATVGRGARIHSEDAIEALHDLEIEP